MKRTKSLSDVILDLERKIAESKEYLKENSNAIDAGYFIEWIPIWEKQLEYYKSI